MRPTSKRCGPFNIFSQLIFVCLMSIWLKVVRLSPQVSALPICTARFENVRWASFVMSEPGTISGAAAAVPIVNDDASEPICSRSIINGASNEEKTTTADKKRKKTTPYANLKKKKKERAATLERIKGSLRNHDVNEKNSIPNDGSYASPPMQKLFNISLPDEPPIDSKASKKKLAILMSYVGSKFAGFQINKDQRTVQAELELAIYKAGLLQQSNFGFPHKYGWSVSGRTDKGVHACAQVCSAKLEVGDMTEDEVRERINSCLHPDIKVLDVKRALRSFCAKTHRSRVRYQYMIPSYLFYPDAKRFFAEFGIGERVPGAAPLSPDEIQSLRAAIKDYRISPQQLTTLKSALALYTGTHAYHNFTKGMNLGDSKANRYIMEFTADDPVIREDGTQWIPTQVLGQSFLLNQIRKMIALACDVVCERATLQTMEQAFDSKTRMILPLAPAQGLFLDMSVYDHYNERRGKCVTDTDDLDWINQPDSPAMQRWKSFKDEVVLKKIVEEESEEGNFVLYLYMQTCIFEWKENYRIDSLAVAE